MRPEAEAAMVAGCFGTRAVIGSLAVLLHGTRRTIVLARAARAGRGPLRLRD